MQYTYNVKYEDKNSTVFVTNINIFLYSILKLYCTYRYIQTHKQYIERFFLFTLYKHTYIHEYLHMLNLP